jgi:hypothetical protein
MTVFPVSLSQALATFSDVYSLRIIGRVSDYDGRRPTSRRQPVPVDSTAELDISE